MAASDLRIGDAEREAAAADLREHYARGRLTLDEFQQRIDAVFAAKTGKDLAKITSDLPQTDTYTTAPQTGRPGPGFPGTSAGGPPGGPPFYWQRRFTRSRSLANAALIVLAVIVLFGVFRPFGRLGFPVPGPLFILIFLLAFGRGILRRLTGRRPMRPRGRRWRY